MRRGLQPLEAAVLDKLLAGDHPVLVALRRQVASSTVTRRELTGVGFFVDFSVPESVERAHVSRFHLGDVEATIADLQHGAGFVLFVNDGLITMLEGFCYHEVWPAEITEFALRYHDPARPEIAVLPCHS